MFFSAASFSLGFATGFGTGLFTREITHVGSVTLRPIAKGMIKSTLLVADRSREVFARAGEQLEDLMAEARTELSEEKREEAASELEGLEGEVSSAEEASRSAAATSAGASPETRGPQDASGGSGEPRVAAGG